MKAETPRVAVLGAGPWGQNLIRNFEALGALALVCDPDPDARGRVRERFPSVRTAATPEAAFGPDIDAVVVATPAGTHARCAEQAIAAGKDVFVEKPLALDVASGEAVTRHAEAAGRILMVGHLLWYHPAVLRLAELVREGTLGDLRYVYSNRLNLGRVRVEESILWSFAPHDVSVILGLVGEMPSRIEARGGRYLGRPTADVTVTTLAFPSGVGAHVFVSWLHPYKEQRVIVVGSEKMAVFDELAPDKLVLHPHRIEWNGSVPLTHRGEHEAVAFDTTEPLRLECAHFLDCVRTRARPRTDGREALAVLRVLESCEESLVQSLVPEHPGVEIHPTATVDRGAQIGVGTRVWHHAHVMPGARVGTNCVLGQNVFVADGVTIGDRVKIQNNVSVYEGVTLDDDVFCGPSAVFTNVRNPRSAVSRRSEFAPTRVGEGATIGANATIVCGTTIGRRAFVAAGAVVTHDVAEHALVAGVPARRIGWTCGCGERLPEPSLVCGRCGLAHRLEGETLARA